MQLRTLFFLQIDEHWAKWFVPLALSVCMFVFVLRRGLRKRESRWGVKGGKRGGGETGRERREERMWGEERYGGAGIERWR